MSRYIGLMSGTSVDAVDAVLTRIDDERVTVELRYEHPIPDALHREIQRAIAGEALSAHEFWTLDANLGELFAECALALLERCGLGSDVIDAIGSHGQTIYHAPHEAPPLTVQAADPNIIAARTDITTVADFRRRDLALGGQGAPLAPAFHEAVFADRDEHRAIVNIGGISNVTVMTADEEDALLGFDAGPGNTLMDAWCQIHRDQAFDDDGAWAASGRVNGALLERLLRDPYFSRPPPKSTGREHFNMSWLQSHLDAVGDLAPADVQRTLLELSARSISDSIQRYERTIDAVYLCGGGALNVTLRRTLHERLGNVRLETTSAIGMHPKDVEGAAFAWLAHRTLSARPANAPSVTGASAASVLGAIYPATGKMIKY